MRRMKQYTPEFVSFLNWEDTSEEGEMLTHEFAVFKDVKHLLDGMDGIKNKYNHGVDDPSWTHGELGTRERTKHSVYYAKPTEKTIAKVKELRTELTNIKAVKDNFKIATNKRSKIRFDNHGDELDINRLMCGAPDYWSIKANSKVEPAIKLFLNLTLSCGNSEENFQRLAALTAVAAELLQRMGKNVEIKCIAPIRKRDDERILRHGVIFTVKRAEEPIDIYKIASLGCPGLFRDYIFRAIGNCIEDNGNDMGSSEKLSEDHRQELGIDYMIEQQWINGKEALFVEDIFSQEMAK